MAGTIDNLREKQASRHYVIYVIALVTLVNIWSFIDRIVLSILLPSIQLELKLSDSEVGILIGLAYSLIFAVSGIPVARLADRAVRRDIIAAAIAFWSVATTACGAAQNLIQLFMGRVSVAIGESGVQPASSSLICDYVPQEKRGGAFAIVTMGNSLGVAFGWLFAGLLNDLVGWRWTFVILGLPGLLLALLVRLTLREPPRGMLETPVERDQVHSLMAVIRRIVVVRSYRWLVIYSVAALFTQNATMQWLPSFLVRSHGLSTSDVGFYLAIVALSSGIAGALIGGALANRFTAADARVPLWLSALAMVISVPAVVGVLLTTHPWMVFALLGVAGLCWAIPAGSTLASMQNVISVDMRATSTAIMVFTVGTLGLSLGPVTVGVVSDLLQDQLGTESLRYALLVPICASAIAVTGLLRAARHLPGDLQSSNDPSRSGPE